MKSVCSITVALLITAATAVPVSASVRCDICKKEISGKYVTGPDNTPYCWECYTKYSACYVCGKLFKTLVNVDDRKVCRDCYAELEKCDLCGRGLLGNYMVYPEIGMSVCAECERTSPRCQSCNRPARKLNRVGNALLCNDCAPRTDRCYSCGDALLDNYKYFENDQSRKYCERCVKDYAKCSDCGAPSGPRGSKLEDGRYLCPDCRKEAIFNPSLITPIKLEVLDFLEKGLTMSVDHEINYAVQDKKFLEKKSKGLSEDINGLFYRKNDDFSIFVLYGLRKRDLIWVLAHETTHAWQAENCSDRLTNEEREGFAQWAAYHTAIHFGYRQYAENMLHGESVYSRGLNRMIAIEKNGGSKAVFDYIKSK